MFPWIPLPCVYAPHIIEALPQDFGCTMHYRRDSYNSSLGKMSSLGFNEAKTVGSRHKKAMQKRYF